jgi:hypothetical protein
MPFTSGKTNVDTVVLDNIMSDYRNAEQETCLNLATADTTSIEVLKQLATDKNAEVRMAVASNPNTPQDILRHLGQEFPDAIVANPIFNILLLENPESQFIRLSLARSSTTSLETLAKLAKLPDEEILCAIAQNPNTPVAILEQLVQHPPQIYDYDDPDGTEFDRLFSCIARNPNTPESLLIRLAQHSSGSVEYAIVENPNTPAAILEKFANWRNSTMHQAIARNPNAPTAVLEKLAGEQSGEIRKLVKAHPKASDLAIAIVDFMEEKPGTPIHLLEKFAKHSSPSVRRLVADHPHTPSHVLELLSLDSAEYVPLKVAKHPNASATALEGVAKWLVTKYQQASPSNKQFYQGPAIALIKRSNVTAAALETLFSVEVNAIAQLATAPPSILLKLTEHERSFQDIHFLGDLVKNPNTPAEAIEILVPRLKREQHPNTIHYLSAVAEHPNTPVQLLEELATHQLLCTAVGKNPSTPVELLRRLANDPKPKIGALSGVAENKNTPVDLLLRFVASSDVYVRQGLAGNTAAPVTIVETLANDRAAIVRAKLAKNPSVPVFILERLAADPDDKVHESLVKNPKTPTELLAPFVDAPNRQVRRGVAKHPNASIDSVMRLAADPDYWVRGEISQRPDLCETVLEKLAETTLVQATYNDDFEESDILDRIAIHPQTPVRILEMLATNQPVSLYQRFGGAFFFGIRIAVASNVNAPISVLEKLAEDKQPEVRTAAKKTLKAKF